MGHCSLSTDWGALLKHFPVEPIPDPTPIGVFIHNLADGRENRLTALEGYTKLRGTASIQEDKIRIQNNPDNLEDAFWKKKRTQFKKDKCEVMQFGKNN